MLKHSPRMFCHVLGMCWVKLVQRVLKTKTFTQKKTPQQTMTDKKDFYRDILNCQCAQQDFISKGKWLSLYFIFTLKITYFLIIYYRCHILRSLTSYLCFSPVSFAFFNLSKAADRPPLSLFSLRERDFANPCSTTDKSKCLFFLFSFPT